MATYRSFRVGLIVAGMLHGLAIAGGVEPPPQRPVTEIIHGHTLTDEYRWMEQAEQAETLRAWIGAESDETRRILAPLPIHGEFESRIQQAAGSLTRVFQVVPAHARLTAFQRIGPTDRMPRLVVRTGRSESVLVDPNQATPGKVLAVNNHSWSPSGRYIAVHTAEGGAEVGRITIHDLRTGRTVGPPIEPVWGEFRLTWIDDEMFAYTRMATGGDPADPLQGMTAYVQRRGDPASAKAVLGPAVGSLPVKPKDFPMVGATPLSPWVLGILVGARADFEVAMVHRRDLKASVVPWRQLASLADRINGVALRGQTLFMQSSALNPYGAIKSYTLSDRGAAPRATVMEGRPDLILEGIEASRDGLYVRAQTDGRSRLFFSAAGTAPMREIDLPGEGSIGSMELASDGASISIDLTGWLSNTTYYRVQGVTVKPMDLSSDTWSGSRHFKVRRLFARSADGTQVPLVALLPDAPMPQGGYPALLQGYGSYGSSSTTPYYDRMSMAWLALGGVKAHCGTRGGGERGRAWHDAGRERNKALAHADFVACAETLRAEGLAKAAGPVGMGTSAGGLLVPPAAIKQPGAFAGVVARVGITNPSRLGVAINGANQFEEMGDPATPDGFAALLAQDAYELAATASDMPDMLLTIGLNDKRVAPWMSAKLAARAKARFGDRRSILLRADAQAGHGIGSSEDSRRAEFADIFTFAWQRASR